MQLKRLNLMAIVFLSLQTIKTGVVMVTFPMVSMSAIFNLIGTHIPFQCMAHRVLK